MVAARIFAVLAVGLALGSALIVGCHAHRPGHGNLLDKGPEPVQELIEQRLAAQRDDIGGDARWENFKDEDYQSTEDIDRNRGPITEKRRREELATELIEAGPVQLTDSLMLALEFNDQVQARRAAIKAVGGDELVVRSRFLPQLFYDLDHESRERKAKTNPSSSTDNYFRISQTLLEFGKDNEEDVLLREAQREALFDYEDAVSEVLSEVRQKFFTIILRQQQLMEREVLLDEFEEQYERMKKKEEKRVEEEVNLLTAKLNVLNEETRINSLRREVLRLKIDLLHLIGLPVAMTDIEPAGELAPFELALDKMVAIALRRSTGIALARAEMVEQGRVARQVLWEYGPEMQMKSGWKGERTVAGMELSGEDGFYELSPFAEYHLERPDGGFAGGQDVLDDDEKGWFLGLSMELPIFKGLERTGRYRSELARLREARHELRDIIDQVELEVRKSYQSLLESRKQLQILDETVKISKKRLQVKERLKELDRIDDNELETFRERFFSDQDRYFVQQIVHVQRQEELRLLMRHFEN